jgi:DNA-binding NarL/FixJ family response regulator
MVAKEIAGELAISLYTVKAHLKEAKRRLRSRTLAQAAVTFTGKNNNAEISEPRRGSASPTQEAL